ncbi:hypothetical protein JVZ26_004293 [Escherichia coli]|nr:hypothetical protein [Escherichia coli]
MERISIGKLRYVEPVVYQSREDARKASLSGEFIVYALGLTEQAYRRLESFCIKNNLVEVYKMDILDDPHDIFNELRTKEFMLRERSTRTVGKGSLEFTRAMSMIVRSWVTTAAIGTVLVILNVQLQQSNSFTLN